MHTDEDNYKTTTYLCLFVHSLSPVHIFLIKDDVQGVVFSKLVWNSSKKWIFYLSKCLLTIPGVQLIS